MTESLPHHWYDTPNIHLLTLRDFLAWADQHHVTIAAAHALADDQVHPLNPTRDALYAEEVLLVVQRA